MSDRELSGFNYDSDSRIVDSRMREIFDSRMRRIFHSSTMFNKACRCGRDCREVEGTVETSTAPYGVHSVQRVIFVRFKLVAVF